MWNLVEFGNVAFLDVKATLLAIFRISDNDIRIQICRFFHSLHWITEHY